MSHHHRVNKGECLSQIAHRFGFADYKFIYDHPQNSAFKRKRPDPNLIFPGDRIFIPDREPKQVDVATGGEHRFRLRTPMRKLNIRLVDATGEPIRNAPYTLAFGAERRDKNTDADGVIDEVIPVDLETASFTVEGMTWTLEVGHLNPIDEVEDDVSGTQARLKNLGYNPGPIDGRLGDRTRAAIRAFQTAKGLTVDGVCSPAVIDALKKDYGC
jgi:N-acetylmuramoyl-L-alanine amidase